MRSEVLGRKSRDAIGISRGGHRARAGMTRGREQILYNAKRQHSRLARSRFRAAKHNAAANTAPEYSLVPAKDKPRYPVFALPNGFGSTKDVWAAPTEPELPAFYCRRGGGEGEGRREMRQRETGKYKERAAREPVER